MSALVVGSWKEVQAASPGDASPAAWPAVRVLRGEGSEVGSRVAWN
jgi:hypothetical protein